jgi:hypothetical protein
LAAEYGALPLNVLTRNSNRYFFALGNKLFIGEIPSDLSAHAKKNRAIEVHEFGDFVADLSATDQFLLILLNNGTVYYLDVDHPVSSAPIGGVLFAEPKFLPVTNIAYIAAKPTVSFFLTRRHNLVVSPLDPPLG